MCIYIYIYMYLISGVAAEHLKTDHIRRRQACHLHKRATLLL